MLLNKELKGKFVLAATFAIPGFVAVLNIPIVKIINVTFNMNPKFTKVTLLNSFIFARYIFFSQILPQGNLG